MNCKLMKKLVIDMTLDSSEALMFTKGAKHCVRLPNNEDEECVDFGFFDQVELSIQLARDNQGRFDFITDNKFQ